MLFSVSRDVAVAFSGITSLLYIRPQNFYAFNDISRGKKENSKFSETDETSMLFCGDLFWIISATRIKQLIGGFSFGLVSDLHIKVL